MSFSNSKAVILFGFGLLLVLLAALTVIWIGNVSNNSIRLQQISNAKQKSEYVFLLRDAAHRRSIALYRMTTLKDPFDQDDEYVRFNNLASQFLEAREKLLTMELTESETRTWEEAKPLIRRGSMVQREAVEAIHSDRFEDADRLLKEEVIPVQVRVMEKLTQMHESQNRQVAELLSSAELQNYQARLIITTLSAAAILVGVFITFYVVRRTSRTENALIDARTNAQEASRHKSVFLANMSHEIRTPLAAVIGFAENLLTEKQTPVERLSSTKTIIRNARHLMQIINDILDLSKIESNKMQLEVINVNLLDIFSDVESLIGGMAREKGLRFEVNFMYPLPEVIRVDPIRLKQVLLNLLGNAIKFTSEGVISLTVNYDQFGDRIVMSVEDTGIGMDETQQERLFNAFEQADLSTTRKHGGTGLGLAITREFIHLMDGEIEVQSKKGSGTRISVNLNDVSVGEKRVSSRDNGIGHTIVEDECVDALQGKVLIAEDSPDLRELISMSVRKTGASVELVENGKQALERAMSHSYDLILMDIQMPVMDGAEAITELRKLENNTPIIALTANAMKEERESYLKLGANDFIAKPIERDVFFTKLKAFLPKANLGQADMPASQEVSESTDDALDELSMRFISNLPAEIDALRAFSIKEDWRHAKEVAHKLKGLGGSFGYPEITRLAQKIEDSIKNEKYADSREFISRLRMHCNTLPGYSTGLSN